LKLKSYCGFCTGFCLSDQFITQAYRILQKIEADYHLPTMNREQNLNKPSKGTTWGRKAENPRWAEAAIARMDHCLVG
jgi:hypothetical protein